MNSLNLTSIDRVDELDPDTFLKKYVKKKKPVIFRTFAKDWPATQKWTYDYFKSEQGDVEVPIQSEAFANSGASYLSAQETMKFSDYLDLIEHQPTKKRIFLYNIFKGIPGLCKDFSYPNWPVKFLKSHPFIFFGGATSYVDAHYDADLSQVFLTQFLGKKKIILFSPKYSKHLYRHPLTVSSNVDIGHPDFKTYPKLKEAKGLEGMLEHGDTLYMPSGYWHYVSYITGGFSLALRARANSPLTFAHGLLNLVKLAVIDYSISKVFGAARWYAKKEKIAHRRANNL